MNDITRLSKSPSSLELIKWIILEPIVFLRYADSLDDLDEWYDDPFNEPDPLMDTSLEQMVDGPVEPPEMDPMDGPVEDPYKPMG